MSLSSLDDAKLRALNIATADSRQAKTWTNTLISWANLVDRLQEPIRLNLTTTRYRAIDKEERQAVKDVGGYVAGRCDKGSRKASAVTDMQVVRLDMDGAPTDWQEVLEWTLSGFLYAAHTTTSHTPGTPRVRVLVPLNRPVTAEEYGFVARQVAMTIGEGYWPDLTTFRHNQMMFWPSVCSDGEWIFVEGTGLVLDVDEILEENPNWDDLSTWPMSVDSGGMAGSKSKQQDPLEKKGWVGAFCKNYNINEAIENFLPGVYISGNTPDRYSYTNGSLRNGLVVYNEARWAYSYHAISDPAAGQLLNSWDLVRIHLYGELDEKAGENVPNNRRPSFLRMLELAKGDSAVLGLMAKERLEVADSFDVEPEDETPDPWDDSKWLSKLTLANDTFPKKTFRNLCIVLRYDPEFCKLFRFNSMSHEVELTGKWETKIGLGKEGAEVVRKIGASGFESLSDHHISAIRNKLERRWGRDWSAGTLHDAVKLVARDDTYHPIVEILDGLSWDGVERLETWLTDYCDVEDSKYTRQVSRKVLISAVARAREPGCKCDYMLMLLGEQETGKSAVCRILALQDRFFTELRTVDPKIAAENIGGIWIVEMPELEALNKSDTNSFKAFLTVQTDRFRPAYGRTVESRPRTSIVIGTSNEGEVLKDPTGGRRFWPVATGTINFQGLKLVVEQLYAEADLAYMIGENLWLEGDAKIAAKEVQEENRQGDPWEESIRIWLEKPIPKNWYESGDKEYMFEEEMVERTRVCAQEIMAECLQIPAGRQTSTDKKRVGTVMRNTLGWDGKGGKPIPIRFGKRYGVQKGWNRIPF